MLLFLKVLSYIMSIIKMIQNNKVFCFCLRKRNVGLGFFFFFKLLLLHYKVQMAVSLRSVQKNDPI